MSAAAPLRIGIAGCGGRMGRMLLRLALERQETAGGVRLAAGTVPAGATETGKDLGILAGREACGLHAVADHAALFAQADAVVDFTTPSLTVELAERAVEASKPLVTGTTGLSVEQQARIVAASTKIPLLQSFNMSFGVNVLAALVERAAALLEPASFDIEIVEMHHRHKVDAPSGTALLLGEAAAKGRSEPSLAAVADYARHGQTGPRQAGRIGLAALRGGGVIGEHEVIFAGEHEKITLAHQSQSREIYAEGAIRAALWLAHPGRKPGLYAMRDMLGL